MNGDYLWDKSGEPDPEVQELEGLLSRYRHQPRRRMARTSTLQLWVPAAVAALVLVAAIVFLLNREDATPTWSVETIVGREKPHLGVGDTLRTGSGERVRIQVADIGRVEVAPESELQLVRTGATEHRMRLQHGEIEAFVTAPPRLFVVDTPLATAVDLGCRYTLTVDETTGQGRLAVSLGYVQLERGSVESYVPRGASCTMTTTGPGIPYFDDAPQSLRDLNPQDSVQVQAALAATRTDRDTLTLWHVFLTCKQGDRSEVIERIVELTAEQPGNLTELLDLQPKACRDYRSRLQSLWN